jgi:hypothetical protein
VNSVSTWHLNHPKGVRYIRTAVLNPEFKREEPNINKELSVNLVKGFREEGELVGLEPSYRRARHV